MSLWREKNRANKTKRSAKFFESASASERRSAERKTHLLVEQFARLLLYRVDELHLAGGEAHQQGDALRRSRDGVEVMARGLRSFVYPLVYWLTEISSLETMTNARE